MGKITRAEVERARGQWSAEFRRLNPALTGQTPLPDAKSRPVPEISAPIPRKSPLAVKFEFLWAALGGPALTPEYRFDKTRRWRFDFCHNTSRVAIELEGVIKQGGRHQRLKGFASDCEKYLTATIKGWTVFRLTRHLITDATIQSIIAIIRCREAETRELGS